jgi:hypothetical protein
MDSQIIRLEKCINKVFFYRWYSSLSIAIEIKQDLLTVNEQDKIAWVKELLYNYE